MLFSLGILLVVLRDTHFHVFNVSTHNSIIKNKIEPLTKVNKGTYIFSRIAWIFASLNKFQRIRQLLNCFFHLKEFIKYIFKLYIIF